MPPSLFTVSVPTAQTNLTVDCPEAMRGAVEYVLSGEYESGHDGVHLTILDIGANVGSFALWASRRWPGSMIHCFEPNPGTFDYLMRNTAGEARISCTNAAVFPGAGDKAEFHSRFAGDGEAGLAAYSGDTFRVGMSLDTHIVDVVPPQALPRADIVKLDIEGGEAAVLAALDLSATSLVLSEFQNRRNRIVMQETLARAGFIAVRDEECPWDPILDYKDYRQDLKGDVFGHMFYERQGQMRLTRSS